MRAVLGDVGDDVARAAVAVQAGEHLEQLAALLGPAAGGQRGAAHVEADRDPVAVLGDRPGAPLRVLQRGGADVDPRAAGGQRRVQRRVVADAAGQLHLRRRAGRRPRRAARGCRPRPKAASRSTRWIHSAPASCQARAAARAGRRRRSRCRPRPARGGPPGRRRRRRRAAARATRRVGGHGRLLRSRARVTRTGRASRPSSAAAPRTQGSGVTSQTIDLDREEEPGDDAVLDRGGGGRAGPAGGASGSARQPGAQRLPDARRRPGAGRAGARLPGRLGHRSARRAAAPLPLGAAPRPAPTARRERADPVAQQPGAGVAGLLRVELGRRQRAVLHRGHERLAVLRPGDQRRREAAGRDAGRQLRAA